MSHSVWEQPEAVDKFTHRDPDLRLLELIDEFATPRLVKVLDLGCAGGRNSEVLARRGFDLLAIDGSQAMVARTRERLAAILGAAEAERRVRRLKMDNLGELADCSFDLVVALGIYHCAEDRDEWESAVAETARVLKAGGQLLVAAFTPETDLTGQGIRVVPGEPDVFEGLPSGRSVLVDQQALDAEMRRLGLITALSSRTVRVETGVGRRVTVNGRYRKLA